MKRICSLFLFFLLLTACSQPAVDAPTWQEQYDLGVRYLSEGNYEEAIIAFTAAIQVDSKIVEAYIYRGDAYNGIAGKYDQEDARESYEAAITDYLFAIEMDKTNPELYLKVANVYVVLGNKEEARAILKKGFALTAGDDLKACLDEVSLARTERSAATMNDIEGYVNSEYNDDGWVVCRMWHYTDDSVYQTENFAYYNNGLLKECHTLDSMNNLSRYELHNEYGQLIYEVSYGADGSTWENTYTYNADSPVVTILLADRIRVEITYTMSMPNHSIRLGGYGSDNVGLTSYSITESKPLVDSGQIYHDRLVWSNFSADGTLIASEMLTID